MKYGYHFYDWGLWEIDELLEVEELKEDYITKDAFGTHKFKKEDWCLVKASKPIFILPQYKDGNFVYTEVNEGPYYKKNIFDTKEEAEDYGRKHSSCNFI